MVGPSERAGHARPVPARSRCERRAYVCILAESRCAHGFDHASGVTSIPCSHSHITLMVCLIWGIGHAGSIGEVTG
jgi:hypothetical protein